MELEKMLCPNCGAAITDIDGTNLIAKCKYCDTEFMVKNAVALAKVEVDKSKDIINLRKRLNDAVNSNSLLLIRESANKILDIIPEDFSAGYYLAYAEKQKGSPKLYEQFLSTPISNATTAEIKAVLKHLIENSDLRDRHDIDLYICNIRNANIDNNYYRELHRKVFQYKKSLEENYEVVKRDVFVCYRSTDIDVAATVVRSLEQDGYSCWISTRNLRPNDSENYWSSIEKNIKACKLFLVVASEDAMVSRDVREEIQIAREYNKRLIEFKIDNAKHTTFFKEVFDGNKWIDATEQDNICLINLCKRVFDELEALNMPQKKNAPFVKQEALTDKEEASVLLNNADDLYRQGKIDTAKDLLDNITKQYPNDYRPWLELARIVTKNFTDIEDLKHIGYIDNARSIATTDELVEINKIIGEFEEAVETRKKLLNNKAKRFILDVRDTLKDITGKNVSKLNQTREKIEKEQNNEVRSVEILLLLQFILMFGFLLVIIAADGKPMVQTVSCVLYIFRLIISCYLTKSKYNQGVGMTVLAALPVIGGITTWISYFGWKNRFVKKHREIIKSIDRLVADGGMVIYDNTNWGSISDNVVKIADNVKIDMDTDVSQSAIQNYIEKFVFRK